MKPGPLCANCVERPATHAGRLERGGYEPNGGLPTNVEAARGVRRAMGAERYELEADADRRRGQRPSPAVDPGDVAYRQFANETRQRIRTTANDSNHRSRRERKLF